MSTGISFASLEQLSNAKYRVKISNIEDIQYCTGLTHLTYVIIYNLLKKYNPNNLTGSRMTDLIGKANYNPNDLSTIQAEFAEEMLDLENRLKALQSADTSLSEECRLGKLELLNVNLDKVNESVIIKIRIININGLSAFIEVV